MATTESLPRSPFPTDRISPSPLSKSIPILPSAASAGSSNTSPSSVSASDPMEIVPTNTSSMPPPAISSPAVDRHTSVKMNGDSDNADTNGQVGSGAVGAAAAAQQPKIVQTAFIHKLYNMLEDQTIQHLISWSNSNESFVMSPCSDFSKVLSQYFKHTNISSFVRQLNMYGFHKVSDVFHTGAPDSALWEFRHGNGNFKRGDLVGLREIKRRASRHALIHRDSFPSAPKPTGPPQPGNQLVENMSDPLEARLNILEHNYFDMHARLARSEDSLTYMTTKCQLLSDGLMRCHQWNLDLATYITAIMPDPESKMHNDVITMQREIARQTDLLRSFESPPESAVQDPRQPHSQQQMSHLMSHLQDSAPPLSPRQMPLPNYDLNQRRPSQPSLFEPRQQQQPFRPPVAPHLSSVSPRRYGSIGSNNSYSPSASRAPAPPPPSLGQLQAPQHPLATVSSPPTNLSRRHTSADIRLNGWQGPPGTSPPGGPIVPSYASGMSSSQWPSSPSRGPVNNSGPGSDQALRDVLARYELPPASSNQQGSRHHTPPPISSLDPASAVAGGPDSGWVVPGSRFPGFGKGLGVGLSSGLEGSGGPPTRRSSMASNLHGLLNPAGDSGPDDMLVDDGMGGAAKRKRLG